MKKDSEKGSTKVDRGRSESKLPAKEKNKGKGGDSVVVLTPEEETPVSEPEPPPDPFQDIRYREVDISGQASVPQAPSWDPLVPVRVKRLAPYQPPVEVPGRFTLGLELPMVENVEPLQVFTPATRFTRGLVAAVPKTKKASRLGIMSLRSGLQNQEHALNTWQVRVKSVVSDKTRIAKQMGKASGELVLSRATPLPPLQDHRGQSYGPNSDFPNYSKVKDRYYRSDAFFWQGERLGPPDFSIEMSPTWTQRKFYKPPLSISKPDVESERSSLIDEDEEQEMAPQSLKKLVIKGKGLGPYQASRITTSCSDDNEDNDSCCTTDTPLLDASLDTLPCIKSLCQKPCLVVQDRVYAWGELRSRDQVEIGFECLEGMKVYNVLRLANTGSTSIRCYWVKLFHSDHFRKSHYRAEHFLFDSSDRTLLPNDSVTLKVQFHGPYVGFWREVWHLKTQPALGPDGSDTIGVSLWARSLGIDTNEGRRRDLDLHLEALARQHMFADYSDRLPRYLPIRDRDTILSEQLVVTDFREVPDDVELFEKGNPGFWYHGHAMYGLIQLYRVFRRCRRPTIELDLVEDLTDFSLDMYDIFPEEAEDNQADAIEPSEPSGKPGGGLEEDEAKSELTKRSWKDDGGQQEVYSLGGETERQRKRTEVDLALSGQPYDVNDPMLRSIIDIDLLQHQISRLENDHTEKEDILRGLNEAISVMAFRHSRSCVGHFKHLVCRAALVRAMDDVADIGWKLRSDLRLLDNKGTGLPVALSVPQEETGVQRLEDSGQPSSASSSAMGSSTVTMGDKRPVPRGKKAMKPTPSRVSTAVSQSLLTPSPVPEASIPGISDTTPETKPVITGSWANYRKLLQMFVYQRVECLLLDLLPLMNYDGLDLNLLKPKPEL